MSARARHLSAAGTAAPPSRRVLCRVRLHGGAAGRAGGAPCGRSPRCGAARKGERSLALRLLAPRRTGARAAPRRGRVRPVPSRGGARRSAPGAHKASHTAPRCRALSCLPQGAAVFAPLPLHAEGEKGVYDFTVMQYGKPTSLDKYRGKVRSGVASALRPLPKLIRLCSGQVTVVVNVASE